MVAKMVVAQTVSQDRTGKSALDEPFVVPKIEAIQIGFFMAAGRTSRWPEVLEGEGLSQAAPAAPQRTDDSAYGCGESQ
jgi:hypothetical protein